MNVTVAGAGNVGTQFAVHAAEKGHKVTIFSSRPDDISKYLNIIDENGIRIHKGKIECSTNNAKNI